MDPDRNCKKATLTQVASGLLPDRLQNFHFERGLEPSFLTKSQPASRIELHLSLPGRKPTANIRIGYMAAFEASPFGFRAFPGGGSGLTLKIEQ